MTDELYLGDHAVTMQRDQRRSQQDNDEYDRNERLARLPRVNNWNVHRAAAATTTVHTTNHPAVPSVAPVVAPPPARRACILCGESDLDFIRPCELCTSDYCHDCLEARFVMAMEDVTLFPARCCTLLQIHTALPMLSVEHANKYRSLFEEWMCAKKTYCPSPACSAFLSDRVLAGVERIRRVPVTLRDRLSKILLELDASQSARFFREEQDIPYLLDHPSIVKNPIYLSDMKVKVEQYMSAEEFTQDVQLIKSNARLHGSDHPIARAADELFELCADGISKALDEQVVSNNASSPKCPTCQIAICIHCKKIEHVGSACDNTEREQELAMLAKFGYKQCPRCGHGVRKMFGCSHIVCRCGAGFCWNCCRSIDLCSGGCGVEEDDEEEDEGEEVMDETDDGGVVIPVPDSDVMAAEPPNLDAGGYRRWQGQALDFGEEPEEEGVLQVWSCRHSWRKWREVKDGFYHGDPSLVECNSCFKSCPGGKGASTCALCRLLVCTGCKESFKSIRSDG